MPIVFTIPVFLNMPSAPSPVPTGNTNPNNYLKTLNTNIAVIPTSNDILTIGDSNQLLASTVSADVASIVIKAQPVSSKATVTVQCGAFSQIIASTESYQTNAIPLNLGENNVTITVTAANGSVRIYQVAITRA